MITNKTEFIAFLDRWVDHLHTNPQKEIGTFIRYGSDPRKPDCCCAVGWANLLYCGDASNYLVFDQVWDVYLPDMSLTEIYDISDDSDGWDEVVVKLRELQNNLDVPEVLNG